jgi:prepilin-type N-terminal cleavage/methylation domain-containing protein
MRCTRLQPVRSHGFTLIELVATVAIVGALGSIAASILMASIGGLRESTTRAQLHTEMSIAMDRIDRELRNISLDSGASDIAPNIDSISAHAITWEGSNSLVLDGTNLNLTLYGAGTSVLLADLTALSITAHDENNAPMSASLSGTGCDGVRRLLVEVTAVRNGVTEHLRTKVFLRCTMAGG